MIVKTLNFFTNVPAICKIKGYLESYYSSNNPENPHMALKTRAIRVILNNLTVFAVFILKYMQLRQA